MHILPQLKKLIWISKCINEWLEVDHLQADDDSALQTKNYD